MLASLLVAPAVFALTVEEPLSDQALEARAQVLFHEIRCVVCQGEAISDSPAEVAADFRRAIRHEIVDGKSNEQIKTYLASRYGDGILMNPPFKGSTWLLWGGPLLMVLGAIACAVRYFRRPVAQRV